MSIYKNISHFDACTKVLERTFHLDANQQIFFARELEYKKARSYDVVYPMLRARELLMPSFEAGGAAETIKYDQFDMHATSQLGIIANYAKDFRRVDISGKEFIKPIKSLGASFGYNVQEIRAAQFAGKPLQQAKANAARRKVLQDENQIAWFGDSATGLAGLFSSGTGVGTGAAPTGTWATATPDQIIADVSDAVTQIVDGSFGTEMPNTILLPIAQYTKIATTPRSSTSDTTILNFLLTQFPMISAITWLNEAKAVPAPYSSDVMVVYDRNPDKFNLEIPLDVEFFPPQEEGLEFVVPVHSRISGVNFYYPKSVYVSTGI